MYELQRAGGTIDLLRECQRLQQKFDPDDHADVDRINKLCQNAYESGNNATVEQYFASKQAGWFDITHEGADPFPPFYFAGFLNQHWVQKALGVPVNHTFTSPAVAKRFDATGDIMKAGLVQDIGYVLDQGVKVSMMYGDRDYACNWVQGEAASLKVPWQHQEDFANAGYSPVALDTLNSGGLTRQFGNLSFGRVYQAGHMVPSYQPEAAYKIFMRALLGRDIATGEVDLQAVAAAGAQYSTEGPSETWWKLNDVLASPPHECYIWDLGRCTEVEVEAVMDGSAVVKDWIVVGVDSQIAGPGEEDEQRGAMQKPLHEGL